MCGNYKNIIECSINPSLQNEVFTHSFEYDAFNRLVSKTLPDGAVETYTYNKAGLLETVKNNGQLYVKNINYNEKGQRTLIKYGNNSTTEYFYDANTFRLIQLKSRRTGHNQTLQDLHYTYDSVGNIVEIFDASQETSYYNNAPIEARKRYTYDALYRLLTGEGRELIGLAKATGGGYIVDGINAADTQAVHKYTQEFEYDELGNILKVKHITTGNVYNWTRDYVYDTDTNRLLKHDNSQTLESYEYDARGNMTKMPHLQNLKWTFKDELKEVTLNASGEKAYYIYDSGGSRVRKVVEKGSVKEERYYLGDYEVYRKIVNGSEQIERTSTHFMEDTKTIAQIDSAGTKEYIRYQYDNHLGSASLELDEDANIISYEEYHPFGTTSYRSGRKDTEVSLKRYKYTGKERDEETGLYYYGARYYAAWLVRWTSVDPLAEKYPSVSPYCYTLNNPVKFVDPDGNDVWTFFAKTTIGAGLGIGAGLSASRGVAYDDFGVTHFTKYNFNKIESGNSTTPSLVLGFGGYIGGIGGSYDGKAKTFKQASEKWGFSMGSGKNGYAGYLGYTATNENSIDGVSIELGFGALGSRLGASGGGDSNIKESISISHRQAENIDSYWTVKEQKHIYDKKGEITGYSGYLYSKGLIGKYKNTFIQVQSGTTQDKKGNVKANNDWTSREYRFKQQDK